MVDSSVTKDSCLTDGWMDGSCMFRVDRLQDKMCCPSGSQVETHTRGMKVGMDQLHLLFGDNAMQ